MKPFRASMKRQALILITALLLVMVTVGVALAEAQYVYPGGEYTEVYTTPLTRQSQIGDWAKGSISIVSGIPQNSLLVQTNAFNNDPYNASGGWERKDSKTASGSSATFVQTAKTFAGGYYDGFPYPQQYQCSVSGISCYATSYHHINAYGTYYNYYTSNDGSHSSQACYNTAGC